VDATLQEHYVEVPSARVRIIERPGEGAAVLFLHGITSSARTWEPFLAGLPAGMRGIALDTLGNGYTELRGTRRPLTVADQTQQVLEVIEELEVDRFAGVGHSMGGSPLLRIAWQHPERVSALLLAAPTALGRPKIAAPMRAARHRLTARLMEALAPRVVESQARRALREFAGEREVDDAMLQREAGHAIARPREQARGFIDLIGHGDPREPVADADRYTRITCPVWILRGAEDRDWMPESHEERFRGLIGSVRIIRWEGIGHAPHIQAPLRFAELLGELLATAG
jgi:pimeloyl-ACP methyl ester carboxylesterase